jgi:ssDNA-binding Zn-finger/Zn-ribbon topoisomerase 1
MAKKQKKKQKDLECKKCNGTTIDPIFLKGSGGDTMGGKLFALSLYLGTCPECGDKNFF